MLRKTSGLPRTVGRWVSQVMASVGATLIATALYSALPKAIVPQSQPAPELTSGGKFAARAMPASAPLADDGRDAMPLPRADAPVLPIAFLPALSALGPSILRLGPSTPERMAKPARPPRSPPRAEARHTAPVAPPEPAHASAPVPAEGAAEAQPDDGWVPKVVSTAHAAWSMTSSAGDAVLARVVPQIP